MILKKPFPIRVASFVVAVAILIGFWLIMERFLTTNFAYQGEAFMKGYGHILREDINKGLSLVVLVNLVPSALLTFMFFLLLDKEVQRIAFKILRVCVFVILVLILVYLGMKVSEGMAFVLQGNERVIEIILTWPLRVAGFFLGYKLVKTVMEIKN